jgi:hypothetical protein
MFNSPLLDVTIGLVFIFLLYSLLATSINELIATLFGLRARVLKRAIITGMLSDTTKDVLVLKLKNIFRSHIINSYQTVVLQITGLFHKPKSVEKKQKIGDKFYDHPLIKNYGSGQIFSLPSYIPANNFSTVLIDVLKDDFISKLDKIASYKVANSSTTESEENIIHNLKNSTEVIKIKELLDYYQCHYYSGNGTNPRSANSDKDDDERLIDRDTVQVLQMFLNNSAYHIEKFTEKLENGYDDFMKRVTGWYKRNSQFYLFFIGIFIAVIFNVDTIEIANKLSSDKDAREKLVQLAIQEADRYKDDPRVKHLTDPNMRTNESIGARDSANADSIFQLYQNKIDSVKTILNRDIRNANSIIAVGWDDYGKKRNSANLWSDFMKTKDSAYQKLYNNSKLRTRVVDSIYNKRWIKYKVGYVLKETTRGRKFLGLLLTAFAISLGSPFWFDLLNKLVKLRGAGKKDETNISAETSKSQTSQVPVIINVNTAKPGEEAVG